MTDSSRLEDYLETIFAIEISGELPTITGIAKRLEITKGTVTTGVKRLVKSMMLEHEPYGSVRLTEAGRQKALTIYRRHENVSFLFSEILGIERERAESLACLLEHEIDQNLEQKLFILVDFFCRGRRYGEDWLYRLQKELTHEYDLPKPLAMMEHGEPCEVVRLSSVGPLRIRLLEMGLVPGTTLTLDGVAPLGDPLKIRVRGIELSLRKSEATTVWVRPLQKGPMKGRS